MKFLRYFSPTFMTRLDKYMLVHYPVLWTTRIHYTLFWGVLLYGSMFLISASYPLSTHNAANDFTEMTLFLTLPVSGFALIVWLVYIAKFKVELTAGKKNVWSGYQKFGAYFLTLLLIIGFPFMAEIHQDYRVAGIMSDEELEEDDKTRIDTRWLVNTNFKKISRSSQNKDVLVFEYNGDSYNNETQAYNIVQKKCRKGDIKALISSYIQLEKKYGDQYYSYGKASSIEIVKELFDKVDTISMEGIPRISYSYDLERNINRIQNAKHIVHGYGKGYNSDKHEVMYMIIGLLAFCASMLVFVFSYMSMLPFFLTLGISVAVVAGYSLFDGLLLGELLNIDGHQEQTFSGFPLLAVGLAILVSIRLFFSKAYTGSVSWKAKTLIFIANLTIPFSVLLLFAFIGEYLNDEKIAITLCIGGFAYIVCIPLIDKVFTRMSTLPGK